MCVAPSREAQKPSMSVSFSPLLLSLAQSSSSFRCHSGGSISLSSQPTVKMQRLDELANPMTQGVSVAAAIPINDGADNGEEDDDNIKILIDEDGVDDNDKDAVADVDAQGNVKVGTPSPANTANSSGFGLFVLLDLNESAMSEIKGHSHRKYLNRLQRDYYNKDTMWVKCLHLQLPQVPRSKCNISDMTPYMLLEQNSNKYMQQCIFIHDGSEGQFSDEFKNIMERASTGEKFRSAWGKHEKEFKFDYLFHCFLDTNNEAFPNEDDHQHRVMYGLAALYNMMALGRQKIQLNEGTSLEYMFCPHCGYFTNNTPTMNTHVQKHYKVGLFCAHSKCNFVTNWSNRCCSTGCSCTDMARRTRVPPSSPSRRTALVIEWLWP